MRIKNYSGYVFRPLNTRFHTDAYNYNLYRRNANNFIIFDITLNELYTIKDVLRKDII